MKHLFGAALIIVSIALNGAAQVAVNKDLGKSVWKGQVVWKDQGSPLTAWQAQVKGTFWRNPEWIRLLNLSPDQQRKMDDAFQQYRFKLIDLTALLEKEEVVLRGLLGSTRPAPQDEPRMLMQIENVANARAELEKANGRMLMDILLILTPEQWSNLPMPGKKKFFNFQTGTPFVK